MLSMSKSDAATRGRAARAATHAAAGAANAMPRLIETRFGPLEFDPVNSITLPHGLVGYADYREFGLLRLPETGVGPLLLLQSLENPTLSFIVMPYERDLGLVDPADLDAAFKALSIEPEHAVTFLVVTVRKEGDEVRLFANLRAPLIVDNDAHLGRQYVLQNPEYPVRFSL